MGILGKRDFVFQNSKIVPVLSFLFGRESEHIFGLSSHASTLQVESGRFFFFLNNIKNEFSSIIKGRLVIEFKNYCLKRCENCSLKSVIKIHIFSVYKTKKMCLVLWFK